MYILDIISVVCFDKRNTLIPSQDSKACLYKDYGLL